MAVNRNMRSALAGMDAQVALEAMATSADIAVLIGEDGRVRDVWTQDGELESRLGGVESWSGRAWSETLSEASRPRAQVLLDDAAGGQRARWRQLTHRAADGSECPVLYTSVPVGRPGHILLLGRDQFTLSMLQHRLMEARESIERDHARIRNLESRCRMLLEASSDPMLIIDALGQRVTEANAAAHALFGAGSAIAGQPIADLFEPRDRAALDEVLGRARTGEGADLPRIRLADHVMQVRLRADVYRDSGTTYLLLRVTPVQGVVPAVVAAPPADGNEQAIGRELPRSVGQLTDLIGRVPLRDLVREATDIIERLCIEAALEKTNDNRASAAEILGLSRQSLYVKLHRYGLGDLADVSG